MVSLRFSLHRGYTVFTVAVLQCLLTGALNAEVITDGTVGSAVTVPGSNFVIPQSLGSTAGSNLFHSFQSFNIADTESATFTGSDSIRNIISRVTGGQGSTINGLLRSEVGRADFYRLSDIKFPNHVFKILKNNGIFFQIGNYFPESLYFINPTGVIFGPNAAVDVPAAFHVSTAANLRFSDGAIFNAIDPNASTLSMASPSDFGFVANRSAEINIKGTEERELRFTPDTTTSLIGGEIIIESGIIINEGGEIHVTAVGAMDTLVSIDSGESILAD